MPDAITPTHKWVGASHVPLDDQQARRALRRRSIRITSDIRVEVLDIYCAQCRRTFEDAPETCIAFETTEHLRGGPIGQRERRKHPHHDCLKYDCDLPLPPGFTRAATSAAG